MGLEQDFLDLVVQMVFQVSIQLLSLEDIQLEHLMYKRAQCLVDIQGKTQ
jgi:hypothetical protein